MDNYDDVDWDDDTEEVTMENNSAVLAAANLKKKKAFAIKFLESDYNQALSRHKADIRSKLVQFIQSFCSSIDPLIITLIKSSISYQSECFDVKQFFEFVKSYRKEFTGISDEELTAEEGKFGLCVEDIQRFVLKNMAGNNIQIGQAFAGLFAALGLEFRMIFAFACISFSPRDHIDICKDRWETQANAEFISAQKDVDTESCKCWFEVYFPAASLPGSSSIVDLSSKAWIFVDPVDLVFGDPGSIEKGFGKHGRRNNWYAVSIAAPHGAPDSSRILLSDVTAKYRSSFRFRSQQERRTEESLQAWRDELMQELSTACHCMVAGKADGNVVDLTDSASSKRRRIADLRREEQEELLEARKLASAKLPTTIAGFKGHPVYCLERHLLSNEMLHPSRRRMVGIFNGESIYLVEHRETLLTKLQWRSKFRRVKPDEEAVKVMERTVTPHNRKRSSESAGEAWDGEALGSDGLISWSVQEGEDKKKYSVRLYGSWQTESLQIPPVTDGVLPVNRFGNIEVWNQDPRYVPRGAHYSPHPQTVKVAKTLGIPCVPAVVGFERKGLQNVPKMVGGVVLEGYRSLLRDALFFAEGMQSEQQYERSERKIVLKWEKLVNSVLNREKLRRKYGH